MDDIHIRLWGVSFFVRGGESTSNGRVLLRFSFGCGS